LVLIDGKRKNQSALVYINDTPGKGEVGVDMNSIPAAAIDHIEVLRDGASAQYGSDAIAGVINIILKKGSKKSTFHANSGITTQGDGFNIGADINSTLNLDNGGFINVTFGLNKQLPTNRPGKPGGDGLFGVIFGDPAILNGTLPWIQKHPDLGMHIGLPKMFKGDLFYNAESPFKLLHKGAIYQGFQPTFETDIRDNTNVVGVKFDVAKFKVDFSGTYGRNAVDYTIGNTLNPDLGAASPTRFDAGGYRFSNSILNLDLSRSFGNVSIAFGGELKGENFIAVAGEPASYFGGGAQSFPGLQPSNAVNVNRTSEGAYADLDWDITKAFLISGAVRYENFSDFGNNTSFKIAGRYKLGKIGALRGSYSSGFRAPSLHQIYLSNIQTLVSGGTISNQGTFNNVSPVIRQGLGVPQLHAEIAHNISGGITLKPASNFYLTLDYYNVKINGRVLFTGEIGYKNGGPGNPLNNPVEKILDQYNVTSLKFFINAVNTETNGVDFVANYKNVNLGNGKLGFSLAANYNKTKIVGNIATPPILAANNYDIFNRKEQSRITSARPRTKVIAGINFKEGKLTTYLNNTYFGEVTWQHATDPTKDQTFKGKVLTDLIFDYKVTGKTSLNFTINNLLNVYPDVINTHGDFVTDLGGRFKYPWEVNQFGFSGTTLQVGLTYQF